MNCYHRSLRNKLLFGVCLVAMLGSTAVAKESFNALDHTLQKPLKIEKFEEKKFGDHLFVIPEVGITLMQKPNSMLSPAGIGARGGLLIGDWITPVHGVRIGLNGGQHNGVSINTNFVGLSADYLMNMSALLRGDNPNRLFEVLGIAGLEYQLIYNTGTVSHVGGFRLGLQGKFNLSPLTMLYIEPRVGIYSDGLDRVVSWRRYDLEASVMAGIGYKLLSDPIRKKSSDFDRRFSKNFFFSLGGGFASTLKVASMPFRDYGGTAFVAIGNQLSRISSLRLSILADYLKTSRVRNSSAIGVQLDYMLDMHSLFGGFDPSRLFSMSWVAGVNYNSVSSDGVRNGQPSIGTGLHGNFRLNDYLGLFIEPRINIFKNDAWGGTDGIGKVDLLSSASVGLTYRPTPAYRTHSVQREKETFDMPKAIGDMFISIGGGLAGVLQPSFSSPFPDWGGRGSLALGTWWNAYSGARLSVNATYLKTDPGTPNTKAFGGQLDYMLNLSTCFNGYRLDRLFDVYGIVGVNADYVAARARSGYSIGAGIGLQGVFRLSDMFDFYIEPRLNVNKDGVWTPTVRYVDLVPTLTAGITYNLYRYGMRHSVDNEPEKFTNKDFSDHLIFGVGVGASALLSAKAASNLSSSVGPGAYAYIGKWFSASSGLRLSASAGTFGEPGNGYRKYGVVGVDYLWNINNTMYGYRPDRIFSVILGAGLSAAYVTGEHAGIYPGLDLSLQGLWNIADGWGIFLEPQMRVYKSTFSRLNLASLKADALLSMMLGVQYQMQGYDRKIGRTDFEKDRHGFISLAGGVSSPFRHITDPNALGATVNVAIGKWYTPISAWRIGVDFDQQSTPYYYALALSADYMLNLTSLALQYKSDRVFDLIASAGIYAGASRSYRKTSVTPAVKLGLQGRFNVSSYIDLFIEPQILAAYSARGLYSPSLNPEARVLAGLNYKMGTAKEEASKNRRMWNSDKRNFVSFAIGSGLFSETVLHSHLRKFSVDIDATVGRWFSSVSGARIGLAYDFITVPSPFEPKLNLGTVHADYMLNLFSLFGAAPDRKFDAIATLGVGLGWSGYPNSKVAFGGTLGVQAKWSLPQSFDIFIEPSVSLWDDKVYQPNNHKFVGVGRVLVGTAYRF